MCIVKFFIKGEVRNLASESNCIVKFFVKSEVRNLASKGNCIVRFFYFGCQPSAVGFRYYQ